MIINNTADRISITFTVTKPGSTEPAPTAVRLDPRSYVNYQTDGDGPWDVTLNGTVKVEGVTGKDAIVTYWGFQRSTQGGFSKK